MPDARGRFLGISVPAEAWDRVFGDRMAAHDHDWPEQNPSADGSDLPKVHARPIDD
jgi:hypothetical protein